MATVCIVLESLSASVLFKKRQTHRQTDRNYHKKKNAAKRNEEKLKKKKKKEKEPYKIFPPRPPSKPARFPLCKIIFLWEWALLFVAGPVLINKGS